MNDRIETPLPDPILRYDEKVFDPERASRLLWLLAGELLGGKNSSRGQEISNAKVTARGFSRAPWAPAAVDESYADSLGISRVDPFTPTVAMLSGVCQDRFGFMPEYASISLFADGGDWLGWHTDSDALIGPKGGEGQLVTFSFGATRSLEFAPLGSESDVATRRLFVAGDSAYQMHPATQRLFQHRVPPEPGAGARLSVTFFCLQRDDPRNVWWTLTDARLGTSRPMAAGPAESIYRRYLELDHPAAVITSIGGICTNEYGLTERLKAMGMTSTKIDELNERSRSRRPSTIPAPGEGLSLDVIGPDWIPMAYDVLQKFRCADCGGVAHSFEPSFELRDRYPQLGLPTCIGCVQRIVKRPLVPDDFEITRINRTALQAFALGCDHNGLEQRRSGALERIAMIDGLDPHALPSAGSESSEHS